MYNAKYFSITLYGQLPVSLIICSLAILMVTSIIEVVEQYQGTNYTQYKGNLTDRFQIGHPESLLQSL